MFSKSSLSKALANCKNSSSESMDVTVWPAAPVWRGSSCTQCVKHATEERSPVLSSASSCIHLPSTLCFLLAGAVAPVGTETGMYTQINRDHLLPVNVCQSVMHSSLVMALFVMLLCFVLTEKKEPQEDKQPLWIWLSDTLPSVEINDLLTHTCYCCC